MRQKYVLEEFIVKIFLVMFACLISEMKTGNAAAQDIGGTYIDIGIGQASTNSVMNSIRSGDNHQTAKCIKNSSFKSLRCPERGQPSQTPNYSTSAKTGTLSFVFSAFDRKKNIDIFIRKMQENDSAATSRVRQILKSNDVIALIGQGISPFGLTTSNVADAYTVYWIIAWKASKGISGGKETRSRVQAVKAQVVKAMLATSEITTASNQQKQQYAEALFVQAALINAHLKASAENPAQLEKVSHAVRKSAKASGLDLTAMTLSDNGFQRAE
jgi:hypothetical protein